MLKLLKVISAAVVAAAMIFTSCENGGGFDYVDESGSSPVLKMEGLTASDSEDYDYVLSKEGIMPGEGDGSFTVFVKNAKPAKVFVKSGVEGITFKAGALTATEENDSVGKGGWKSVVSYSVSSDMTDAVDGNVSVIVMFSDSSVEDMTVRVNAKVSVMQESDNYAVIDPVQGEKAEHSLSVSWSYKTGYEPVTVSYEIYKVAEDAEADDGYSYTKVEEGTLDAESSSLTSKTSLTGKSDYCVKVKVIGKSGWYVSTIGDAENGWITTSDDITPPAVPAVEFGTAGEDSFTVVYTKGDDADDTVGLVISVKDGNGAAVSEYTVSAVDESAALYVYDTEDANKVTLKNSTEETGTVSVKGFDVRNLAYGKSLTITVGGLARAKTDTAYTVTVTAYDGCYNHVTGNAVSAKTAGDTEAPVVASSTVKVNSGLTSAKITWENPSDSDFASVTVKNGDEVVKEGITDGTFVATGLTEDVTYTLYAVDSIGNVQAAGIEAKVELDEISVKAEPKYTGSILVTWNDVTDYGTDGSEVSYTYDASCTPAVVSALTGIEAGKGEAHFTGLTAGTDYTFTVAVKKDGESVVSKTTDAVTAKTVVWTIVNAYKNSSTTSYNVVPYLPKTANSYPSDDIVSRTDPANYVFTKWIVEPGLSDETDSDLFSLVAAASDNTNSGMYMYFDFANTSRYSSSNGYEYPGWYNSGEKTHAFFTYLNEAGSALSDGGELSYATFKLGKSARTGTSYVNGTETSVGWVRIVSAYDATVALYDYGNRESAHTSDDTATGVEPSYTYYEELLDEAYENVPPAAVTGLTVTEKTDSSVTLSWTNPTDVDFDYVKVTCSDVSVSAKETSGTTVTFTGLSAGTSYTFTVTSVDFSGNKCDTPQTVDVTTEALVEYPTSVKAVVSATKAITVTWTDIAATGYTYKVSCDNGVTAIDNIAEGTQNAVFTDLTVGTTYKFEVTAVKDGSEYTSAVDSIASCEACNVVYIKNCTGNTQCGGGTKYLVGSAGNTKGGGTGIGTYIPGITDDAYTAAVENKWIVHSGLSDGSGVSFESYLTPGKYLQISSDRSVDTSLSAGDLTTDGKVGVKGEQFDWGYSDEGCPSTMPLLLVDEPTTETGKQYATFIKSEDDANGNFTLALAADETYYLAGNTFRAYASKDTTDVTGSNSAWNSTWYCHTWTFVVIE